MKHLTLDSPRVRFNWGFHDATHDREMGRRDRRYRCAGTLFCLPQGKDAASKAYRAGYEAGRQADVSNGRPESSESAWLDFTRNAFAA